MKPLPNRFFAAKKDNYMKKHPPFRRRTKIVCTIGPASRSPAAIARLIRAGMNVARLNFSHGTYDEHAAVIKNIRAASDRLGVQVAILQDLSGPKMRIGRLHAGRVDLKPGQRFTLTLRDAPGDQSAVSVNFPGLIEAAGIRQRILLGDGIIELQVAAKTGDALECKVLAGGWLASHQGINAPGIVLPEGVPTEKDRADLAFGLRHGVDWVAQSFVSRSNSARRQAGIFSSFQSQRYFVCFKSSRPISINCRCSILRNCRLPWKHKSRHMVPIKDDLLRAAESKARVAAMYASHISIATASTACAPPM